MPPIVYQPDTLANPEVEMTPGASDQSLAPPDPYTDDTRLLEIHEKCKKEAMDNRWIWEREWLRDLYYIGNRQWITYHNTRREWVDKRLAKWIPKITTNKMAEILSAIRTTLGAINLSVVVRPVGHDTQSIAAAEIADQMSPMLHEEHLMNQIMRENDFWFIATGNACMQLSWDLDQRVNRVFIPNEMCPACGGQFSPQEIQEAGNVCPACGNPQLQPATDPMTGEPAGKWVSFGKGKTTALSPFEYAFSPHVTRFDDLPFLYRLRWRDKAYVESNYPDLVYKIAWEKSPTDRSLQIFKSLSLMNDLGTASAMTSFGSAGSQSVEGITEYELWLKPTPEFPKGLLLRILGDQSPLIIRDPNQSLPGPFPYTDIEEKPIFPFSHAQYEHVGGRLWGRSAISPLVQKQDQLNQLDSLVMLAVQRMSNPVWVIPQDAGIEDITGEPGLVVKWNVLASNGQGKPERVDGVPIDGSLFEYRAQILKDIEELSGAFDIIKGQKPSGIEAFSALQLLVERSQSRFTSAFQSRGEMYRDWFSKALELERQFGPQQRTHAVVGPNRGYTFQHFENAQLQGQVAIQIEDGSNMPKTSLGKRAAIEQANQLRLIDPMDPDQRYALLTTFGLSDLSPSLNIHVQSALQLQDSFERWVEMPQGPMPLVVKPWFDPMVHWTERVKWLNTDKMREILAKTPELEPVITLHLQELQTIMAPPPQVDENGNPIEGEKTQGGNPKGSQTSGGQALGNSNKAGHGMNQPSGNKGSGPNQGPM